MLVRRTGPQAPNKGYLSRLWAATATSVAVGWALLLVLGDLHPIARALIVLGAFGCTYLGITLVLKVPEAQALLRRVRPRTNPPA